jgi:hypothetical protein
MLIRHFGLNQPRIRATELTGRIGRMGSMSRDSRASTSRPCSVASSSGPRRRCCTAPINRIEAGCEAGWLVVAAQWRKLENSEWRESGLRSYSLLDAKTLVLVNHMVRLSGLMLSQGK